MTQPRTIRTWCAAGAFLVLISHAALAAGVASADAPRIPDLRRADGVPTQLSTPGRRAYDGWAAAHGFPLAGELPASLATTKNRTATHDLTSTFGIPGNVRINNPAGDAANETQSETGAAAYGRFLITTYDDSRGLDGPPQSLVGYSYSVDGGSTWTDGGSLPLGPSGQLMGHSTVAADSAGNFVVASLYLPNFPSATTSAIAVSRGRFIADVPSFDPPITVVSATADFFDQPRITIDPVGGNVYITYLRFVLGKGTGQVECVRSTNSGVTWNTPVSIQNDGVDFIAAPTVAVGTNGEVYVVFENHYGYANLAAKVRYAISVDGGLSFGPRFDAADLNENWYAGPPGFNRVDGFREYPVIAVDRSTGPNRGNVYIAWNESTTPVIGGFGVTSTEVEPNDTVGQAQPLIIPRRLNGTTSAAGADLDYFRVISTFAGQMILVTVTPSSAGDVRMRLLAGTAGDSVLAESYYPSAKYGAAFPALAWMTLPSADTFYIEVRSDPTAGQAGAYQIDLRGVSRTLTTPALDHRDIAMIRSTNHGATWSPPIRINDDAALYDETMPMASVDSLGALHLFWYDRREGSGVRASLFGTRSTNGGSTVAPNISVTDFPSAWQVPSRLVPNAGDYSSCVSSGSVTHPMWADMRNGSPDVYTVSVRNGISLACPSDTTSGPSTNVTLSWTITNLSAFGDAASFIVSDSLGWLTGSSSGTVSIGAGGSAVVSRTFAVPALCNGALNRVTFTASAVTSVSFTQTCRTVIAVPDVNCAPVVGAIANQAVAENALLVVTPVSSDPDGDTLSWTSTNLPAGATVDGSTGVLSWTPTFFQSGTYPNVTLTANDGHGGETSRVFTITVTNENRVPVLATQADTTIAEAQSLALSFAAADEDNDPLTWSAQNLPIGAVFTPSGTTAALTWTPSYLQAGVYTDVMLIVDDGLGGRDTTRFAITVTDVPRDVVAAEATPPATTSFAAPCDTVALVLHRDTAAAMRGASVTIALSPELALCAGPESSILQGPYLANGGQSSFQVLVDGGGYTIDQVLLGEPCGPTDSTGVLAYVLVRVLAPHTSGTVSVTGTDLRSCVNQVLASVAGGSATVTYGNTAPVVAPIADPTIAENALLTVTPSATDVDGDGLTWHGANLPGGASVAPATGVLTWTPSFAQAGAYPDVRLVAADAFGGSDSASFTIFVTNTNRAPVVDSIPDFTVAENALLTVTPSAVDLDGDAFTWSGGNLPLGASVAPLTGVLTWTPDFDQAGSHPGVTLTATDSLGAAASRVFTIVVTNVNRAPLADALADQTVAENALLTVSATATDPDGDTVTWSGANLPAGASVAPLTGELTWTPSYLQAGVYTDVMLIVDDGLGGRDTTRFAITVTDVPRDVVAAEATPPATTSFAAPCDTVALVLHRDTAAAMRGASVTIALSPELALCAGPESSILQGPYLANGGQSSFQVLVDGGGYTIDQVLLGEPCGPTDSTGVLAYVLVRVLAPHTSGTVSVTGTDLRSCVNQVLASVAGGSATVTYGNTAPVVAPIADPTIAENALLTVTPSATDVDGDGLTWHGANLPGGASVAPATGVLTWTPSFAQAGAYPDVRLVAADAFGGSDSASFTIFVTNTNRAPVVDSIPDFTVAENALLTVTPSAVDLDGDAFTWSGGNLPLGASVAPLTGVLTWTPDFDQAGSHPGVTLTATDSLGAAASRVFTIVVTNVNRAPLADALADQTVAENALLTVSATATDPDGDTVTWSGANLPAGASVAPLTGELTWTPSYLQAGTYPAVALIATDAGGLSDTTAFTVTVSNVNDPPVVNAIATQTVDETSPLSVTPSGTDPDLDPLTWSGTNLPAGASVSPLTGVLTWAPDYEQSGAYPGVGIIAADGVAGADTAFFTIVVNDVPRDVIAPHVTGSVFVSATESCAVVPVVAHRATAAGMRGVSVRIHLSSSLVLCDTPAASIIQGPYLSSGGAPTVYQVLDLGGGNYVVDQSILGLPCGVMDSTGVLFTVAVTTTAPHVSGTITVTAAEERTCDNDSIRVVAGAPALVPYANTPPVVAVIPNQLAIADAPFSVTPSATDADGDVSTWSGANIPSGASVNPATGELTWTPTSPQIGTYPNVSLIADDSFGGRDTTTFTITVVGPTAVDDDPAARPAALRFDSAGSEIFARQLTFTLAAPEAGQRVLVQLRDVAGRTVARTDVFTDASGRASVVWDPRTADGAALGAGVYFLSVDDGATRVLRRLVHIH